LLPLGNEGSKYDPSADELVVIPSRY
jgi:hypothetical protein